MSASAVRVPYIDLAAQHRPLKAELLEAVGGVIDRAQFVLGPEVAEFEKRLAGVCSVRYAVGLNSGTDALILALRALSIGPGDEVITAANSFVASASSIALVGATPVLVDVRDDYNMDPVALSRAITPRTKAVMPVHLTGRPADMDPILAIAKKHGLFIVEDCAQAIAAEYKGRRVGSFGSIGCFSLHPLKTLNACGDGGVAVTDDPILRDKIILMRNLGLQSRENCTIWSSNSRLDTVQAAMLLVKLKHLDAWTEARRQNAAFYLKELAGIAGLRLPRDLQHEKAVYHTFIVQAEARDQLKNFLASRGIDTAIHYPMPIHLQDVADPMGKARDSFPMAEKQAGRILSLPVYPELTHDQLAWVSESIRAFYSGRMPGGELS